MQTALLFETAKMGPMRSLLVYKRVSSFAHDKRYPAIQTSASYKVLTCVKKFNNNPSNKAVNGKCYKFSSSEFIVI